jgi:hypothetical protein
MNNTELKALLTSIYKDIDSECITETDTVRMIDVANVLVKYGADVNELD